MRSSTSFQLPRPARQYALLIATPDCRIVFWNSEARAWIGDFFESSGNSSSLPSEVCHWLTSHNSAPLLLKRGKTRLVVRRYRPHPPDMIALLLELVEAATQETLRTHRGLTRREGEVLGWIAAGKSNREIAEILELSPATVSKHLERVFVKLGVENRTSAANYYNRDSAAA